MTYSQVNSLLFPYLMTLVFLLGSCSSKFDRQRIDNDDIQVVWYYESYISSTRDFVAARANLIETVILNCNSGQITGIRIQKDTILIKIYDRSVIYSSKANFKNYVVKIDSATYDEWTKFYQPELYKQQGGYQGK